MKEIEVTPDNALMRYTIPMPDDSPIPGRNAEEMALNGSVLSTVKNGGLYLDDGLGGNNPGTADYRISRGAAARFEMAAGHRQPRSPISDRCRDSVAYSRRRAARRANCLGSGHREPVLLEAGGLTPACTLMSSGIQSPGIYSGEKVL